MGWFSLKDLELKVKWINSCREGLPVLKRCSKHFANMCMIYINYIYIFSIHIDPSEKCITFLLSRPARSFLSLKVAEFVKQSRPNTLFEGWRVSSSTPALCGCTTSWSTHEYASFKQQEETWIFFRFVRYSVDLWMFELTKVVEPW